MSISIERLFRFPVKGLRGEELNYTELNVDEALAHDRRFAFAIRPEALDAERPTWVSFDHFISMKSMGRMTATQAAFAPETRKLTLTHAGVPVAVNVDDPGAAARLVGYMRSALGDAAPATLAFVEIAHGSFSDQARDLVSLINLATVRAIEAQAGMALDPLRFRGNIYVDGLAPWAEFDLIGATLQVGDTSLRVLERIDRCRATNFDPFQGVEDVNLPLLLRKIYGHIDCGVFLHVERGGRVAVGDAMIIAGGSDQRQV